MFDAALVDDDIAGDALAGLTAQPKTLPPKLFYDAEGVRLFEAITQLPEYYLTRTERALLLRIAPEIAALAAPGSVLVEYGGSDESKARILLDTPDRVFGAYVPVDVARGRARNAGGADGGCHIPGSRWIRCAAISCGRSCCRHRRKIARASGSFRGRRSAIWIPLRRRDFCAMRGPRLGQGAS